MNSIRYEHPDLSKIKSSKFFLVQKLAQYPQTSQYNKTENLVFHPFMSLSPFDIYFKPKLYNTVDASILTAGT